MDTGIDVLRQHLLPATKPEDDWGAGNQLTALRTYLDDSVMILWDYQEDNYQGDCFAILYFDGWYALWRDSFGSCSGCDGLEGQDGYGYIRDTLVEGSVKTFRSIDEMKIWIKHSDKAEQYFWYDSCDILLNGIDEIVIKILS